MALWGPAGLLIGIHAGFPAYISTVLLLCAFLCGVCVARVVYSVQNSCTETVAVPHQLGRGVCRAVQNVHADLL